MLFYLASAIAVGVEPVPVATLEPGDTTPLTVVKRPPTAYWTSAADEYVPHSLIVSGPAEMLELTDAAPPMADNSTPPASLMRRETIVLRHEEDPDVFGADAWATFVQSVSEGN